MTRLLKELQEEELTLRAHNTILAREAINFGYKGEFLGPEESTRGRKRASSTGATAS
eukprot:CAMPEP_0197245164 /NCGR_PEP_ID=MMETSP1429-20130617/10038_1 /TAXON_ID=49237 /ORGANISM="Chaetoceros  sp., Strain UNC1202" /LENGTH=56 /DNA_ID=CAMNT_0042705611 /DNA_START=161 /DNA_END=331 /DNA_ORIENTATION=-